MNLQQLVTFSTVLTEGSMTAAAEKLCLTQPAVSQQIRNLEEELSVELLVRGSRQIKATFQGELLNDYARKIIHLTQQAEVAIQTMGDDIHGNLRIGTLNSIGLHLISPVIGLFLKHNTKIKIKLLYGSGPEILDLAQAGELDLLLLPDIEKEYGRKLFDFESRFLVKDEMWLVGTGKDMSLPRSISLNDFPHRPIVYFGGKYPAFEQLLSQELTKLKIIASPVFESTNVGTIKRVIESGLGWGFMPAHCIRKQIRTGRLTYIDVKEIKYESNLMYYARETHNIKPISDLFYRALMQNLRG